MKKELSVYTKIALLIFVVTTIIDRFVFSLNRYIYISALIVVAIVMIIGYIKGREDK